VWLVRSADDSCGLLEMQMACDWRAVAAMAHVHRRGHVVVVAGRSTTMWKFFKFAGLWSFVEFCKLD
jgi:hypothetical protein